VDIASANAYAALIDAVQKAASEWVDVVMAKVTAIVSKNGGLAAYEAVWNKLIPDDGCTVVADFNGRIYIKGKLKNEIW